MPNIKYVLTYICVLSLLMGNGPAYAFGTDGHRIIAGIVENHLSDKTTQRLKAITGGIDLGQLSLWPDKIRGSAQWKHTKSWHYINIADREQLQTTARSTKGDVLSALEESYRQLQLPEGDITVRKRREALAFFMHFAADIHQPLHVGRWSDRGGNLVGIQWSGKTRLTNLHWVWDSGLLKTSKLSVEEYVKLLDRASHKQIRLWQQSGFFDWARESKMLRPQVYEFGTAGKASLSEKKPRIITQDYINRNKPIVEKRLLMAGIRIAGRLNRLFDPASSQSTKSFEKSGQ